MQLAVWDQAPAAFLVSGLTSGAVASPFDDVEAHEPHVCTQLLKQAQVDMALVPTLDVLTGDEEDFDVLPAVALSTWHYPFARLALKHGLDEPVQAVAFDPRYKQEAMVARIVLKEHYGMQPTFRPVNDPSHEGLLAAETDAALLVGEPSGDDEGYTMLELGQEWFELVNYPMVWGLFAVRKGTATPEMIEALRASAAYAEAHRALWADNTSPEWHAFYTDDLRVRLDDLAVASLTEYRQYLFYYHVADEVVEIPFVAIDDDTSDEEEKPLL